MNSAIDQVFRGGEALSVTVVDTSAGTVVPDDDAAATHVLLLEGTTTAARRVTLPLASGWYWLVHNATANNVSIGAASGARVTLAADARRTVFCDGAGFYELDVGSGGSSTPDVQTHTVTADATLTSTEAAADLLVLDGTPGAEYALTFPTSTRDGAPITIVNMSDSGVGIFDHDGNDFGVAPGGTITFQRAFAKLLLVALAPTGGDSTVLRGNGFPGTVPAAALPALNIVAAYSARPAAGVANRIFVATDTGIAYHDDGTAWRPMIAGVLGTAPPATTATIVPAATTYTEAAIAGSHAQRFSTTDTANEHLGAFFKSTVSGSSWAVEAAFSIDAFTGTEPTSLANGASGLSNAGSGAYPGFAIVIDNGTFAASGGAGVNLFAFTAVFSITGGSFGWNMGGWTSAVSRSAYQDIASFWAYRGEIMRMRVRYDASKYYCDINHDGLVGWREIGQVAASTLTGPARYGVAMQPWGGALAANLYSLSKS